MISVIIPVYNAKETLEDTITSICNNTYKEYEILLVDDGSTDGSSELCDALCEKNPEIRVFHQENQGAAAARNQGVRQAKGEYIAFVDSDDLVSTSYLAFLNALCEKENADIAVCDYKKTLPGEEAPCENAEKEPTVFTGKEACEALLYQDGFISVPWGMISRKTLWEEVSFPEGTQAEDMGTIYRLFLQAGKVVKGHAAHYAYVQRATNTVFSTASERNQHYFKHSVEMVHYIKEHEPQILKAAAHRHFSACCQILSETKRTKETAKFVERIYRNIKKTAPVVRKDKKARKKNRFAARLAKFSIPALHKFLEVYYKKEKSKL